MRCLLPLALLVALAPPLGAQSDAPPPPPLPCPAAKCPPGKKDLREAQRLYQRGERLSRQGELEGAFDHFDRAARLHPARFDYLMARESTRQQLVFEKLMQGNVLMEAGHTMAAVAAFREALELDPTSDTALQRLRQAAAPLLPQPSRRLRLLAQAGELRLRPRPGRQTFRFRGDARELLQRVGAAYGVTVLFDESVASRRVRFEVDDVEFVEAMRLASIVTRTFWVALAEDQLLVAQDSAENRRQFEPMALRTFYVPDAVAPEEIAELLNILRNIFEIRLVTAQPASGTLVVRAPVRSLEAATRFLEGMDAARAQVLLDVKVFEVSRSMLRNLGLDLPLQYRMFNVSAAALDLTQVPGLQELINQLIASGAINQANSEALGALLQQVLEQQSSIFREPFATFGGGSTLMGLVLPAAGVRLSRDETHLERLQHLTVRAAQGDAATVHMGARYPILNASFAPIFGSPALAQVLGTGTFIPPFPSFTYEDLGITLKATPRVQHGGDVQLQLEVSMRALSGVAFNAVPVLSNREYGGTITVPNGATVAVIGAVSESEQRSLRGLPGLGRIPGLGRLVSTESKEQQENQLLMLVTPYVLSAPRVAPPAIWLE